jgi:hypothetical protein
MINLFSEISDGTLGLEDDDENAVVMAQDKCESLV